MKKNNDLILLFENLSTLDRAAQRLSRSHGTCGSLSIKAKYEEDDYDLLEILTSRFARVSDILVQKIFRGIDKVEYEEGGSLLDIFNRADKRGLLSSISDIREIRDLRNSIAHEYALDNLTEVFKDTLIYTPILLNIIEKTKKYCERFTGKTV